MIFQNFTLKLKAILLYGTGRWERPDQYKK